MSLNQGSTVLILLHKQVKRRFHLTVFVGRYIPHCARGSDDDTTWTPIAVGVRMKDEARD